MQLSMFICLPGYSLDEWHLCAFNLAKCILLANVRETCREANSIRKRFQNSLFHFRTEIVAIHFYDVMKEECMLTYFREQFTRHKCSCSVKYWQLTGKTI